ncbi:MAG: hypothetical protein JWR19_1491, partial [Pedosphaera sp.]|nr:hypothetical protein [Pedosphaera sp.]
MRLAWIGRGNNYTHRFLVESFEPTMTLQILQMTAQRPFLCELLKLFRCDQP